MVRTKDRADVVVVGNGVLGYSTALALQEQDPKLDIVVIGPRQRPGAATPAAGAMLGCFGEVTKAGLANTYGRIKHALAIQAHGMWADWVDKLNEMSPAARALKIRPGTYVILNSVSETLDTDNYDALVESLQEHGQTFETVHPEHVPGMLPVAGSRPLRALYMPDEGSIDSADLLSHLSNAAAQTGQITEIDSVVNGLQIESDRVTGVICHPNKTIAANMVLIAAGVGSQTILDTIPELAQRIPRLFSGSGTSALLTPEKPLGINHVIRTPNRAFACGLHVVPRANGTLYVGATNNIHHEPQAHPNVNDMIFLLKCLTQQINEDLYLALVQQTTTGNRPMSMDTYPLLGETSVTGLWMLSGTFRDGLQMSPLLARDMARRMLGRDPLFENHFPAERKPLNVWTRSQAIDATVLHYMAVGHEHAMRLPDGWNGFMNEMFRSKVGAIYDQLGDAYVLPPEFIPLLFRYPALLPRLREMVTALEGA